MTGAGYAGACYEEAGYEGAGYAAERVMRKGSGGGRVV